ncbi:TPA: AmmeMemoRadiSam system protein B [Candidatus Falkowbacteria bacterium]|nr:MAG: AMMECR1 domain protein [Candidatus Falkowbacteria bacterium GW2011_GWF2_43_32]HBA36960.1 AmmeMemoRadiSam system protein B [Candidatus Falkowbacteria bacterium]
MALIAAALLPHSPLLIPEIGRVNYGFLAKTVAAYETIGARLKTAGVETIILISQHGFAQADAFTINIAPEMEINLKNFGFINPKTTLTGDIPLADEMTAALRVAHPLRLISEPILDYGSAVPLYLLKSLTDNFKIVTVSPAHDLSLETLADGGIALQTVISASTKKIAVIVSGDLSHRLKKKSPGGYSPKGAKFDNKLIEYLNNPLTAKENITKMDMKLVNDAGECGLRPLVFALGMLADRNWQPEVLAYQTDFGIGYLSFEFQI